MKITSRAKLILLMLSETPDRPDVCEAVPAGPGGEARPPREPASFSVRVSLCLARRGESHDLSREGFRQFASVLKQTGIRMKIHTDPSGQPDGDFSLVPGRLAAAALREAATGWLAGMPGRQLRVIRHGTLRTARSVEEVATLARGIAGSADGRGWHASALGCSSNRPGGLRSPLA